MDKFVTRSSSDSNLSTSPFKRPGGEIDKWHHPKRFAVPTPKIKVANSTTTTNRFGNLPLDKEDEVTHTSTSTFKKKNSGRVPPIWIELKEDWTHQKVKDIVDQHSKKYHLEYKGNNRVKIQCHTTDGHQAVKGGLLKDNVAYHTFTRKDEKLPKVVIKGLPGSLLDSLTTELESLGFPGAITTQIKLSKPVQCPPIIAQLPSGTDMAKFKQIRYLSNCAVTIERYRMSGNNCTQCYRCQSFGHASRNCNRPPRCVKCSQAHPTSECPNKGFIETVRCCNCEQDHPASYPHCKERLKYLERIKTKRDSIRAAAAATYTRVPMTSRPTVAKDRSFAQVTAHVKQPEVAKAPVVQQISSLPTNSKEDHLDPQRDTATNEMLQILCTIKTLKQEFTQCETFMDKVILILTKLGHYV